MGGPGTGKTFSAMATAASLSYEIRKRGGVGRIAVADSEQQSAKLYAMSRAERARYDAMNPEDGYAYIKQLRKFPIDVDELNPPFTPESYINVIKDAAKEGYDITIADSISHAWAGTGGSLDRKGKEEERGANSWAAWRKITPEHNRFVDAMLSTPSHLIVTMRMKVAHAMETDDKGKTKIVELGMEEIQRDGVRYEFTLVGVMDHDHALTVVKTRLDGVIHDGDKFERPGDVFGRKIYGWVNDGDEPAPPVARPVENMPDLTEARSADLFHRIELAASEQDLKALVGDLGKLAADVPSLKTEIRKRYDERGKWIKREAEKFAASMSLAEDQRIVSAVARLVKNEPTGTLCSVCHEPQFRSPSGDVCKFGHGSAPPIVDGASDGSAA
jgi:hypothetical protein